MLACLATCKQGLSEPGKDDKENYTVPTALWKILEPRIQQQINIAQKYL